MPLMLVIQPEVDIKKCNEIRHKITTNTSQIHQFNTHTPIYFITACPRIIHKMISISTPNNLN